MKKARKLSILCDVQVAVVFFSSSGKLYESCAGANRIIWRICVVDLRVAEEEDTGCDADVGCGFEGESGLLLRHGMYVHPLVTLSVYFNMLTDVIDVLKDVKSKLEDDVAANITLPCHILLYKT
ncbi:hypothetical protein RJ639_033007 [Escallonia herrerae]|uniref:MADS-box domain-containing protein n=1 Tax=Escallonia herrerae TaxID=1293975 RepID=A0AA88XCM2_9ASTE|nr:hypothetical protein RJ639_033007 [Escallonia herrerae]